MLLSSLRALCLAGLLVSGTAAAVTGYYRDPAIHDEHLVFASEGDLWLAGIDGGPARRLTSHPARESQPSISADGRRLAFAADYDGATEAYVMPLAGGTPKRLSFEGGRVLVQGWTPDGEVLYATDQRVGPTWSWTLHAVHPDTLARRELPLADAREAAFDERGRLYFSRFGLAVTADNAREYRGGARGQLWRFDPGASEAVRIAAGHAGTLSRPMWWQGRLYAVSDADGVPNLWSFDADGGDPRQLTAHRDFEVRGAQLRDGRIVYQRGADIARYDIASGEDRLLPLDLATDTASRRTRWLDKPLAWLDTARLSADGKRVVLTARGRVAVAGAGAQRRVEPALPDGSRARNAVASPDGRWIYAIGDAGGEHEVWRFPADGSGPGKPLTRDGTTQRFDLLPSPDGRWLAHSDFDGALWLLDLASGANRRIDRSPVRSYEGMAWSPDSRALVVVRPDTSYQRDQLVLHTVADGGRHVLTSDRYNSHSPAFTPDGRWLYFLSEREFNATPGAPWGDRNMGPMFDRRTRIYALALQPGNRFAFQPPTELRDIDPAIDADVPEKEAERAEEAKEAGGGRHPRIAVAGLAERLYEVPVDAGNYRALAAGDKQLFVLDQSSRAGAMPVLRSIAYRAERARIETLATQVAQFALSADAKTLFYRTAERDGPGRLYLVPVADKLPGDLGQHQVRVDDWRLAVDPAREWAQMFDDAWRMQRDYLFDPGLRGQDWAAIAARYRPLVARVGERTELDDLLGQMVAELGVLHSQVRGGEYREDTERPVPASLGGTWEAHGDGVRLAHVYRTDPELPDARAPLARTATAMRVGDVVTAINGQAVRTPADIALRLEHQAGQQVRIDYRRDGRARSTVAVPVTMERDAQLRYSDWVQSRRERVEQAGGGRIGYLHLYAMGPNDIAGFAREFYANIDREGLVIDVRRNRGGNIDSWVLGTLLRRAWAFWAPPGSAPYWNMQQSFRGHLVVLADELTYSDGETFSAGIKALGLGPVIGQRTAGAGVWLSDSNRLVDRGVMRAAQTAQFDPQGRWLIEGLGVAPDIAVENLPHATWKGGDAQLDRGVAELLRRLEASPVPRPQPQAFPPRGRYDEEGEPVVPEP
ncbi:S41 family peptidase [Luteimonas arsenica]|uniref:S41 family peptidase n=1 Tax=Luteimonas arsenica TaxID=1586242 RepID=UPI001056184E|nr:S41 family peptidase [Luteimonas arsenica]